MKGCFIFLTTLISLISFAQNDGPQMTVRSNSLKGPVRSVTEHTLGTWVDELKQYHEKELYASKVVFYKDGFIDSTFSRYNDKEPLQFDYHYYWIGDTLRSSVHKRNAWYKVVFDKKQRPVYQYSFIDGAFSPNTEQWFRYDNEGKLVEKKMNASGKMITIKYSYTKNKDHTYLFSKSDVEHLVFVVDSSLRRLKSIDQLPNSTFKTETKFTYDRNSNIILEEQSRFEKKNDKWIATTTEKTEYQYQYDSYNNWFEKKTLVNGKLSQLVKREIVYW